MHVKKVLSPAAAFVAALIFFSILLPGAAGEAGEIDEFLSADEEELRKFMDQDFERWEKLRHLAFYHQSENNMEDYVYYLERAAELKPDNDKLNLEAAIANHQKGRFEESARMFEPILAEVSQNMAELETINKRRAYYYAGQAQKAAGDYSEARSIWKEGTEIDEHPGLYQALADSYMEQEAYEQALDYFEKAVELDNSFNHLYPDMAETAEYAGEYEVAFEYWRKSMNTGIRVETARNRLEDLRSKIEPDPSPAELYPEEERDLDELAWQPRFRDIYDIKEYLSGDELGPEVKVGLGERRDELLLQTDDYKIVKSSEGNVFHVVPPHTTLKISLQAGKFIFEQEGGFQNRTDMDKLAIPADDLIIYSKAEAASFFINDISYGQDYYWAGREDRQYRGDILLSPDEENDEFTVINRITMEEYLLSVVPAEMPSGWPQEALKAQALAARSYFLSGMSTRHPEEEYDFCDTVHCAVYNGVRSENERTNQAVKATAGEVGKHDGRVISAVFSSNSGGQTQAGETVWGGKSDYLQSISLIEREGYNDSGLPGDLQDWFHQKVETYSGPGPYTAEEAYRWMRPIKPEFIEAEHDISELENLQVTERGGSGFVQEILISSKDGAEIRLEGGRIRGALGGLRSNNFIIHREYNEKGQIERFVLYGAGWGHGVGMDQTAAANMASEGRKYDDIFRSFYRNTDIDKTY